MKIKTRLLSILLAASILLALTACDNNVPSNPDVSAGIDATGDPGTDPSSNSHKVAMILPGAITDMSWNYTSYDGLKKIEAAGAEISFQEKVDTAQVEDSIRTYASSGYDLIYIGSNIFEEQTMAVAPDYPGVTFVIISGSTIKDNVVSFQMSDAEKGFLMGVISGLVTEKGSVGLVSSVKITPLIMAEAGFQYGVSYVNPDAKVSAVMTGKSTDTAASKETAKAMIDAGADVISANANAASPGSLEAAQEHGVACVAPGAGYESIAASTLITYVMMDNSIPVYDMYEKYLAGQLPADLYEYSAKDGVVYVGEWQDNAKATDEVKAKVQAVYDDLAAGKITIPQA